MTYSSVELGASLLAKGLGLLLGLGAPTRELTLDLCGCAVGIGCFVSVGFVRRARLEVLWAPRDRESHVPSNCFSATLGLPPAPYR